MFSRKRNDWWMSAISFSESPMLSFKRALLLARMIQGNIHPDSIFIIITIITKQLTLDTDKAKTKTKQRQRQSKDKAKTKTKAKTNTNLLFKRALLQAWMIQGNIHPDSIFIIITIIYRAAYSRQRQ